MLAGILIVTVIVVILALVAKSQILESFLVDDPVIDQLKKILTPVHPSFQTLALYKGDKSYTINKEKVFMCLKDENNNYYPLNMLVYVLLHEMAHLLNKKDIGHTEEFYRIFDQLLDRATRNGVYNPNIPVINNYCATKF